MSWYVLIPLIATFTNFSLGLGVFLSDVRNSIRKVFALLCSCVAFWNLCSTMIYYLPQDGATFWSQLLLIPLVFIGPIFFHFVLTFIKNQSNFKKSLCIAGYVFGSGLLIINRIIPIIVGVERHYWGYFPQVSHLSHLIDFQFLSLMIYGIYLLAKQYANETSSVSRNQIKYLFIGVILAFASSSTNFAPFMGIELYPLGHLGQVFYNFIIAYAIIKHRLLDINLFFKKTFIHFTSAVLFFGFCFLIILFGMNILVGENKTLGIGVISLMIIITVPLGYWSFGKVRAWTNQRFAISPVTITTFSSLNRSILTSVNINELIKESVIRVCNALKLSKGSLLVLDDNEKRYKVVSVSNHNNQLKENIFIPNNSWLTSLLLERKEPVIKEELEVEAHLGISDKNKKENLLAAASQLTEIETAICIPLLRRGKLIGMLNFGQKKSGNLFTSPEIERFAALGENAAIALENVKLVENLRNRMKELGCLSEIAYNVMSARSSMEVEHQIYESLSQIIDYDKCIYFKFDESSKNLKLEYAYGLDENIKIALEQSPIEVEYVIDDILNDNHNLGRLKTVLENIFEMRSVKKSEEFLLTTPVLMKDKLYGFFCVFNSKAEFSEEEKQLLLVIASQIVLLYQRMTSSLSYAEKEAMTRAVGQIAHDMSHAVGIVRGSFQILHMRLTNLSENNGEIMSLLDEGMKNLGTLLDELKMLSDPEKTRLHREDVNATLNKTLEIVEPRLSANNINVITELEPSLTAVLVAGGQLFRVFLNLIVNAIEAMPQGGTLKLVTKLKKFDKYIEDVAELNNFKLDEEKHRISSFIEVTINDTGCGIPDNVLSKIFKCGFTTKDDGNGLGLAEVKRVINMCGGKIDVQSEVGVGSSFIITLPNG